MAAAISSNQDIPHGKADPESSRWINVRFINDCPFYQGNMYFNDWRKKGNKITGSNSEMHVPYDSTLPCPLRVTFMATFGAYIRDKQEGYYLALVQGFKRNGTWRRKCLL